MGGILALLAVALVIGVPVGVVIALNRIRALDRRIDSLERRLSQLRSEARPVAPVAPAAAPAKAPATAPATATARTPATAAVTASSPAPAPAASARTAAPDAPSMPRPAASPVADAWSRSPSPIEDDPDWITAAIDRVRGWFSHGNVPVKVGMVVLFAGIAALLKYAADQGWMRFPIEWRLLGIAAAALGGLAFGWRQRHARRIFGLSLQGGALGVLLLTAYAAWKLYGLLDPLTTFLVWVALSAAAALLAVWQDARALAVLGILAGFLAPILMSTGSGHHVALFSFYAVLNAAIFAIAWHRAWRELNLLGFFFTFGIGTLWGLFEYQPDKLASTLPFLLLFFAFYLLLPILHARRPQPGRAQVIDACLVFGTPLLSFAQLAGLLEGDRMPLAGSALALAALYAALAWRAPAASAPLLRQAHAVLAVGFATLAVPLALSAQVTGSVFALEGAALVWLGLRQARRLPVWAGSGLQVTAALCLLPGLGGDAAAVPVANAVFMGLLLLAVGGFGSAWSHARHGDRTHALGWFIWALAWWLLMGLREIHLHLLPAQAADVRLMFFAMTAALAALALRIEAARALAWTAAVALALGVPAALDQAVEHRHPFVGWGLAAWLLYAALGVVTLAALRRQASRPVTLALSAWLIAWSLALSLWLGEWAMQAQIASGWRHAAAALPWLLAGAGLHWWPRGIGWPLQAQEAFWRRPLINLWHAFIALAAMLLALMPGDAQPLPWIPVLNPLELALAAALLLLVAWLYHPDVPQRILGWRAPWLALAFFLVTTSITLRAVHHLGDVPWDRSMFGAAPAQAALSLVWSVLGVAGWIVGSRRRQRDVWRAGALLMGVVLAKLVLVDRLHLGNLPGIASFIGYGLLCTLVGYLAPAPPREAPEPARVNAGQRAGN